MRGNTAMNEALVTKVETDAEGGDRYYSIVTLRPARVAVWGQSVWRAGRADLPADRMPKPGAPDPSPGRGSQQPAVKPLGKSKRNALILQEAHT